VRYEIISDTMPENLHLRICLGSMSSTRKVKGIQYFVLLRHCHARHEMG